MQPEILTKENVQKMIENSRKDSFNQWIKADTPTDAYSVVNRKYLTQNGATGSRPTNAVVGQQFFNTSTNIPNFWDGSNWRDAAGNIV